MSDSNFRLSRQIQAERYVYTVTPDLEAHTFSARGRAELRLSRSTNRIVLHGVALDIARATIGDIVLDVTSNTVAQTLCFVLPEPLSGLVSMELAWKGELQRDLRGFYRAGSIAVTQFEAADARRVFPCLDEPSFKAVWELALEVPAHLSAISNGTVVSRTPIEGGKKRVAFAPTPRMSSYLVAMVVGDLGCSEPIEAAGVPIQTWSVPEKVKITGFAQQCAAAVLPMLEAYFDTPYAFGKLDQIGVPDFEAGAMENSGCITYREVALLLDEHRAPLRVRKRVAETITHELSHQWFGNLVTMQWWDDLWLNEAFATWMAYKIVNQWRPHWRIWDDFEVGKQFALRLDALTSSHPIRSEVENANQASENFDAITYEKGAAILRMFEGFLGEEKFIRGIRLYMARHRFSNAVAEDLWNVLDEATGYPIAQIANNWIAREGYPIVRLEHKGGTAYMTQERFTLDPEMNDDTAPWIIPVILRYQDADRLKSRSVLVRNRVEQLELDCSSPKWIFGNADGHGFYRVHYSDTDLRALADNLQVLTPTEVVTLLSDVWAAFETKRTELPAFLELLTRAATVSDYAVAAEVAERFATLDRLCVTDSSQAAFRKWVAATVQPLFERTGWGDIKSTNDTSLLRASLLRSLAGVAREEAAIGGLVERLDADWQGEISLDPNLLDVAWIAAARRGDSSFFEQLLDKAKTEPDPAAKRRALLSLATFETKVLRGRTIELILDQAVPMQDVATYLIALVGNRSLREPLWEFIRSRWDEIRYRCTAPLLTRRLIEALGGLYEYRDEVERMFEDRAASLLDVPSAIRQTREKLRLDANVHSRGASALALWLSSPQKSPHSWRLACSST